MKQLLFFILAATLAGCTHDSAEVVDEAAPMVTVEVKFIPDQPVQITRAAADDAIKDVNLYLFGRTNDKVIHIYATSQASLTRFKCMPGEYDLYAAANLHTDLGEQTAEQLQNYTITHNENYSELPMSAVSVVTVPAAPSSVVRLPAILLRRNVAKITYNITVDPSASDIVLRSVEMMNIPRKNLLFKELTIPQLNASDYMRGSYSEIPSSLASAYSGVDYVFENPQGSIFAITQQEQKNPQNAPQNATYLLIRAQKGTKALAYTVYLGVNNTDNFDVRRNSSHTLNIRILDDDKTDTRISSYTLSVWDDIEGEDSYVGYCTYNPEKFLYIDVEGHNNTMTLHAKMEVKQGQGDALNFDHTFSGDSYFFDLKNQNGTNIYKLDYSPSLFDESTSILTYTVTIFDDYGFSQSFDFSHRYANTIITRINGGSGTITASGAIHSQKLSGTNNLIALCSINGCTLKATPSVNHIFDGWFADAAFTKQLSSTSAYAYKPKKTAQTLYAHFIQVIPLDTDGTSNSYIAPTENTYYSFDATTQGNGKTTKGLTPSKIRGTEARVIWETGTKAGAVISDVRFLDGRIIFRRAATNGNALIGLFNAAGDCIWSWHIWGVPFNPDETALSYTGGTVFMDRNLGALSSNCQVISSQGLYYQWGRKDPFIYPANYAANTTLKAIAVYHNGNEFTSLNPEYQEYKMTVAYAVAHPTTYIDAATYEDSSDKNNHYDWLKPSNPNLWGNTGTSASLSDIGSKSIYDPCPPGWRVPDRRTWSDANVRFGTPHSGYYCSVYYLRFLTTQYPYSGFFNGAYFQSSASAGYTWTNAPTKTQAAVFQVTTTAVVPSQELWRYMAAPVRCVKE